MVAGERVELRGLNLVGLTRHGFSTAEVILTKILKLLVFDVIGASSRRERGNQKNCNQMKIKLLRRKKNKRRLKTPSQIMALEKFYNEHKYPTEEMKQDLAEELGLTEKQISGWFCHMRLKDKLLLKDEAIGNGRQDRSSDVIQDRGSGRQDSCGSSKHGDYRYVDPKEAIDFDPNSLRNILPKAVSSLEWAISKGKGRVYVHCTAGLGRAPGVTIAYLF